MSELTDPIRTRIWLQDQVVRGLAWLRKSRGLTQTALAEATGWQQPHISKLEDFDSPLVSALEKMQRYAKACGYTSVVTFIDPQTQRLAYTIALGEEGEAIAEKLEQAALGVGTVQEDPFKPVRTDVDPSELFTRTR